MFFEWDDEKAALNERKHGVSFREAATVFGDPLALTYLDPDHSDAEVRYLTLGTTGTGICVIISHTDRGDTLRIISARRMTPSERRLYENR